MSRLDSLEIIMSHCIYLDSSELECLEDEQLERLAKVDGDDEEVFATFNDLLAE